MNRLFEMTTSRTTIARLKDHLPAFLVHFQPDRISQFVKAFGWAAACRQVGIEIRQFVRSTLDRGRNEPRVINNAGPIRTLAASIISSRWRGWTMSRRRSISSNRVPKPRRAGKPTNTRRANKRARQPETNRLAGFLCLNGGPGDFALTAACASAGRRVRR